MVWRSRLLRTSPALPGSAHDPTAARRHGIPDALTRHAVATLADKAYQTAGLTIAVPFKGKHLSDNQKPTVASPKPEPPANAAVRVPHRLLGGAA